MNILDEIYTVTPTAPRITLYGIPGAGKSTLASLFPSPLFLLTEKNNVLNTKALPIANDYNDFMDKLTRLSRLETLPFKTLVLDSLTRLDSLVTAHVIKVSPPDKKGNKPKTIMQAFGGYGAGFARAASYHRYIKSIMDTFTDRGITTIYTAHVETKTCKLPDQEDYNMYSLTMHHDMSRAVYIDDVDMVGFIKQQSITIENESGRNMVKSQDKRIVSVGLNPVHVSKNRYQMPDTLDCTFEAIAEYIPFFKNTVG